MRAAERPRMQRRFFVYALVATVAIGGIAFAADALVVSDLEQVEQLADELTGDVDRVDVLQQRIDLAREPVVVGTSRFDESEDYALTEALAEALDPIGSGELDVVQRSVEVDDTRATVALRVRTGGALSDTTIDLVKNGQGWLVTRVRTR